MKCASWPVRRERQRLSGPMPVDAERSEAYHGGEGFGADDDPVALRLEGEGRT
jgi:hypothetical protein